MKFSAEQFGEWMDRWAGPLRAWLRGRCASPDDVVQETFCRLVQQARVPDRVSAWLFQVAANLAKEEARRGERETRRVKRVAVSEARSCEVDKDVEAAEVRLCIDALPVDLREVVVARLWGDLTFQEIAPIVGVSPATVHRRYELALAELRAALDTRVIERS